MSVRQKDSNGNWVVVTGDSTAPMVGATESTDGESGLVPKPLAGDQDKFLSGSGFREPDSTPTANSNNIVKSGGIKAALDNKISSYSSAPSEWDTSPTSGSTKPVTSGGLYQALGSRDLEIAYKRVLVLTKSSVSALPCDFSNSKITTDMVCINSTLSNPSAQISDWTVDTDTKNRARITGSISGTTDITLYLMESR